MKDVAMATSVAKAEFEIIDGKSELVFTTGNITFPLPFCWGTPIFQVLILFTIYYTITSVVGSVIKKRGKRLLLCCGHSV